MMLFETRMLLVSLCLMAFIVNYPALSEESCYRFKGKANVTIDTDQCLWQNYKQKQIKRFCVESCLKNDTCAGVTILDWEMTQQCCLMYDKEIHYSQPGDQILYYRKETMLQCQRGWAGDNCDVCATDFEPPGECNVCVKGWAGSACDGCATGWGGTNCDVCATKFGPPGTCNTCLARWTGPHCDACAAGWTGPDCQYCEGFGFSTESNCTECIQNGYWKGRIRHNYLDVHLTFTGESCSELVLGTAMRYGTYGLTVADGFLDESNKKLRLNSNWGDIFVTTITAEKSLTHIYNRLLLTYKGMS